MSQLPASRILTKICGTTSVHDAQMAHRMGADYLGAIVEYSASPRSVNRQAAGAIFASVPLKSVAVTVNWSFSQLLQLHNDIVPDVMQLHGDESPELVRALCAENITVWAACSGDGEAILQKARSMRDAGAEAVLIDARHHNGTQIIYGGTGHLSDWDAARTLVNEGAHVVLAGGLNAANVAAAMDEVRPWMVDCVSGVEAQKGIKDETKMRALFEAMRRREKR